MPSVRGIGSIDLTRRDLTLDLARVFCVLVVVAVHLLFVGVGVGADGALTVSRPVEDQVWFDAATWLGQIMPLFFVVGGFASLTAWRSAQRRGESASAYVSTRLLRLAQPALPVFLFYVIAIGGAHLAGVDPVLLDAIVVGVGSPLWFLAAYTLCQALVPTAASWHARGPVRTVVLLLTGVVVVDTLQFALRTTELGYLNFFFVWVLVQQFGFWYADGWFAARRWWQLLLVAVASWALLVPLTVWGPYDTDMLTNLNPPTLPLVLLGLGQACLLRLFNPALAAIMRTRPAQAIVFFFGARLMTIYLWHLPVIIVLAGIGLFFPAATPEPASAAWWWSRIPMFFLVLTIVWLISLVLGRWERPRPLVGSPSPQAVAVAAVVTFLPPLAVTIFGLDVWIALAGTLLYAGALLLIRLPELTGATAVSPGAAVLSTPTPTPTDPDGA